MKKDFENILAENAEIVLDSLIQNDVLKEIPIIGTSLNLYRGVQSIRDAAYLNKVKIFIESVGRVSEQQKKRLIEESKKDEKRRAKFGDALFTAIEQSDSRIKLEYLGVAFEAFLNDDFPQEDLRLICHIIHSSFSDELEDVIENEHPQFELKYLVPTGLAEVEYPNVTFDMDTTGPTYELSAIANMLRKAWRDYKT